MGSGAGTVRRSGTRLEVITSFAAFFEVRVGRLGVGRFFDLSRAAGRGCRSVRVRRARRAARVALRGRRARATLPSTT
ncbi:hypothetical protein, partial [Nonomuraea sp. 10N515B]|uniref:hypothetical protein n=1 Tax=Nonomuraea sp. 10N515B TaxID=3457422 RepID=UPI003FCD8A7E